MTSLFYLIKRNMKLFFRDKGLFFTALITPLILLMLYVTFLGNVYRDAFVSVLDEYNITVKKELLDGLVGGQLFSSLLAVSTVTVAFCANMLMVQDKVTGVARDISITPTRSSHTAIAYYVSTTLSSLIISFIAILASFIYLSVVGWYMSLADVLFIILDVFIMVGFGTALSSFINFFLSTQGQISAVGSIVSSCYGFLCGAYMPLSQLSEGFRKILSFFPGTYGTALFRKHAMGGAFTEFENTGVPAEIIDGLKEAVDFDVVFFGDKVSVSAMYIYLAIMVIAILGAYVLLNVFKKKETK